jgi:hypothetical protein
MINNLRDAENADLILEFKKRVSNLEALNEKQKVVILELQ